MGRTEAHAGPRSAPEPTHMSMFSRSFVGLVALRFWSWVVGSSHGGSSSSSTVERNGRDGLHCVLERRDHRQRVDGDLG